MSLVAVKKKKKQEKKKERSKWIGKKKEKYPACIFESSLGNQTSPATVTAAGYGHPTGTAPKTLLSRVKEGRYRTQVTYPTQPTYHPP